MDRHEASRGLSATAEQLVTFYFVFIVSFLCLGELWVAEATMT